MERFTDRVAIVTGATSGIGRAAAAALAAEGAKVVMAGRRAEVGAGLAAELCAKGYEVTFVETDVRSASSVAHLVQSTVQKYGKLDIAVNNAGIPGTHQLTADYPEDAWDEVMAVNLKGVWLCMKFEIPELLRHGGGAIVNTGSDVSMVGSSFGIAPYVASKHGILGLTRSAALEYAGQSIRINAICPGLTRTEMLEPALRDYAEATAQYVDNRIPMKRIAAASEQAEAILWLCSSQSSFVTGHGLAVDGGILAM